MKLTPHIHLVGSGGGGFDLTHPLDCHVYLIDGGEEAALVDAGAGLGTDEILHNVTEAGVPLERLHYLLLTHGHGDHAGGAAHIREHLPNIKVISSPEVAGWLHNADEKGISMDRAREAGVYPPDYPFLPCEVDRMVSEGDTIRIGDITLEVLETPGHSDGHLSFQGRIDGREVLFVGDLIFWGGNIALQNIWDCRIQEYASSLHKLSGKQVDTLLPGHRSVSLRNGQRHIEEAQAVFQRLLIPKGIM